MRTWLYHRTHAARIFDTSQMLPGEMEALHAEGWRDSPAKLEAVTAAPAAPAAKPAPEALTAEQALQRKRAIAARLKELGATVPGTRAHLETFEAHLAAAEEAAG